MKVGFVTRAPVVWGAERSLLLLTSALQSQGCQCKILVDEASPLRKLLEAERRPHAVVELPPHPALASGSLSAAGLGDMAAELARAARVARSLTHELAGLDLVVAFDVWDSPAVLLAARARRLPVWLDLHETFTGGLGSRAFRSLARFFDGIIAPTNVVLSAAPRSRRSSRVVVPRPVEVDLPSGDLCLATERVAPGLPPKVGIVGQIEPHKGHGVFLDAIRIAQREMPCEGVIIGGAQRPEDAGAFERELRDGAASRGLNVSFVPWTPDVKAEMRKLTLLVNVSAHEAFGRTVVEGIGEGLFPIVNRATGAAEIVSEVGIGALVDADPTSLARGIITALEQPAELARARTEGPTRVAGRYAPPRIARDYLSALTGSRPQTSQRRPRRAL